MKTNDLMAALTDYIDKKIEEKFLNKGNKKINYEMYFNYGLRLKDGITIPDTESGYAVIYIDSADGDLKVKFGDGTVKTISTDT